MAQAPKADWNPRDPEVLRDQLPAYDAMRKRCPVAYSDYQHWTVFGYRDAVRMLSDHDTYSSAVSSHLSVPNGMDPPEHGRYRAIIEPYFSAQRMQQFEPTCRGVARGLVAALTADGETEIMSALAEPFALQIQCAFMGWPQHLHEPLRRWVQDNRAATLARDNDRMGKIALQFNDYVQVLLDERRRAPPGTVDDTTAALMREEVGGRTLSTAEITSILRNWTVGELGTIAASVGIVVLFLARNPEIQQQLRAQPAELDAAIDEILRIDAPLMSNRRITTCPVSLGGRHIEAGERITLMWASANRDEAVFGDPDAFRPQQNRPHNLLYGKGIHVCPGAPLARMELRVLFEELLSGSGHIAPGETESPVRASFPAGGFTRVAVQVQR